MRIKNIKSLTGYVMPVEYKTANKLTALSMSMSMMRDLFILNMLIQKWLSKFKLYKYFCSL